MASQISTGTIVDHTMWGRGKVVELRFPNTVVYFPSLTHTERGPRRVLPITAMQLSVSAVQTDDTLDGVRVGPPPAGRKGGAGQARRAPLEHSLDRAVEWFVREFPGGFGNPALVKDELRYKRDGHALFVARFGDGRAESLLANGDLPAVAEVLDQLFHATNIPSRFEIMAAHDGLKDHAAAGRVLTALLRLLRHNEAGSFTDLVDAMTSLPAARGRSRPCTWPNVTILPFLADPARFMVLKPEVTKRVANRMNVDLVTASTPTWPAYQSLMAMSRTLLERLSEFGASDYIDVQSFIWVTQDLD